MAIAEPDSRAVSAGSRALNALFGIDGAQDVAAAVELLHQADALGGAPDADYALALVSLGDVLMRRDLAQAARWLARSAQRGFCPALRSAAMAFGRGHYEGAQQDAAWCLEQAVARGDAIAAALLAHRLLEGRGTARDPLRAMQLAQLARQAGIAMGSLGPAVGYSSASLAGFGVEAGAVTPQEPDWTKLDLPLHALDCTKSTLCESPRIDVVDKLLDAEECRFLRYCGSVHLKRSLVADPVTGKSLRAGLRTSRGASFVPSLEDVSLRVLQLRISGVVGDVPLSHFEPMVVLHYAPGEQYRPHRDYLPPSDPGLAGPGRQRTTTVCCYLNDGMKGGATSFPEAEISVLPKQGMAVVFANLKPDGQPDPDSLHAGEPVLFGEKWLSTCWIRQGPVRQF